MRFKCKFIKSKFFFQRKLPTQPIIIPILRQPDVCVCVFFFLFQLGILEVDIGLWQGIPTSEIIVTYLYLIYLHT
jgi:hypothetical protein